MNKERIKHYIDNECITFTFNSEMLEDFDQYHKKMHPRRKKQALHFMGKKRTGLLPSWNIILNVGKRTVQNSRKQTISEYTKYILDCTSEHMETLKRCAVVVKQYHPTKTKFDLDNIHTKSSFDAFSEHEIWDDDNVYVLEPLIFTGGHDKENPRTEIIILPITDEYDRDFVLLCIVDILKNK